MAKINEWLEKDNLILLEGWARDGLTFEQIAHNIGINVTTLRDWRKKEPTISAILKKGREVVDIEVENALLKRALGYTYKEVTKEQVKNPTTGQYEMMITKEVTKEVQPDTTAQIFWLKNRKPDKWRDKVVDTENEEAITNATDILVKIRKTVDDRYERS